MENASRYPKLRDEKKSSQGLEGGSYNSKELQLETKEKKNTKR